MIILVVEVEPCRFCNNVPHSSGVPCSECDFPNLRRGYFRQVGSVDVCDACTKEDRPHEVVELSAGATDGRSHWGAGVPSHVRICTGCGRYDGPWVKASCVGGYW